MTRRRTCRNRQRNQHATTPRQNVVLTAVTFTFVGALSLCYPDGRPFAIFCFVTGGLAFAVASGPCWRWLNDDTAWPHNPPPAAPRPSQPQPAPLPEPDLVQTRSGRKPVNRELPADRPHPWRTWEG